MTYPLGKYNRRIGSSIGPDIIVYKIDRDIIGRPRYWFNYIDNKKISEAVWFTETFLDINFVFDRERPKDEHMEVDF